VSSRPLGIVALLLLAVSAGACRKTSPSSGTRGEIAIEQLPASKDLPDPFLMQGGRRVASRSDWDARRRELRELLLRHEYGHAPGPVSVSAVELSREALAGGVSKRLLRLTLGAPRQVTMHVGLIVPQGTGPFPAVVNIDHRDSFAATYAPEIARRGYLFAGYDPTLVDPDQPNTVGAAQAAYPTHDWATLAVWAWGASRVVDHLISLREVDRAKIIVTGHSRSGKTALLAGALDDRVALVAPMCSGTGGAAAYRFRGDRSEGLEPITANFPHWFVPTLRRFVGHEERLPFDQHFLHALVAPRALISLDAFGDLWANLPGTQQSYLGARAIYEALGAADRLGIVVRSGEHEQTDEDWIALLDFADKVFFGKIPSGRSFDRLPLPDLPAGFRWTAPRLR
jgi:hypothetical protein